MLFTEEKNLQLIDYLESMGFSPYPVDGYKVINWYSNLEEELDSIYNGVALRNISHQGLIELKGKDAIDLIHRIGTNGIKDLPKEGVKKTIFTSEKGTIIGLTTLMNFENYQILVCDRESTPKVMGWIRKYAISDDVEVNDANTKYNLLELTGPQAESFATLVCGNMVNDIHLAMMAKSMPPPHDPRQGEGLDLATVARPTITVGPFQENDMLEFDVQDMSCGHCVAVITNTIQALDPGAQVRCDLPAHRVQVETAPPREDVVRALADAGYAPSSAG